MDTQHGLEPRLGNPSKKLLNFGPELIKKNRDILNACNFVSNEYFLSIFGVRDHWGPLGSKKIQGLKFIDPTSN